MKYTVYTKIHNNDKITCWYYGTYNSEDLANEIALELGGNYPVYHCVCKADEAKNLGILNLPNSYN